jgi:hypothetical protein
VRWLPEAEFAPLTEGRVGELEERFAPTFKAAQVLLRERIHEEDILYATLAYAHQLGLRTLADSSDDLVREILELDEEADTLVSSAERNVDWGTEVERASRGHSGMICEQVVDGVVILRWFPVYGDVRYYDIPDAIIPEVVTIRVRFHSGSLKPTDISASYERILSAHGLRYGRSSVGSIDFESAEGTLIIRTYAATETATRIPSKDAAAVFSDRDPEFIHPELMAAFCQALLGSSRGHGFDRFLNYRKSGESPTSTPQRTAKLIRVCVAYFLAKDGGLPEGVTAHQLLNKHVVPLPEGVAPLPEEGVSTTESNALWRATKKAGEKLNAAAWAIQDQRNTS